jgi:hypothetical protein
MRSVPRSNLKFNGDAAAGSISFRDSSAPIQPKWNAGAGAQYDISCANGARLTPRLDYFCQGYRTNGTPALPQRDPDDIVPGFGISNARLTFRRMPAWARRAARASGRSR